ncbi:hypothetical protein EMIT0196P_100065 [Pseudomonas chlororaphis]
MYLHFGRYNKTILKVLIGLWL